MKRQLLGEILIEKGKITPFQLTEALEIQSQIGKKIGDILIEKGFISKEDLESTLAQDAISLDDITIPAAVLALISYDYAKKNHVLPLYADVDSVTVIMADPYNFSVTDDLKMMLNKEVVALFCHDAELIRAIDAYYGKQTKKKTLEAKKASFKAEFDSMAKDIFFQGVDDMPIIKFVSFVITEAHKRRASDIHLEPLKKVFRIRYRIDGVLHEMAQPSVRIQAAVISRVKLMASMDLSEKRLPQDGRIKFNIEGRSLDLRVSTLPGLYGESVVLRILDRASLLLGLNELGFVEGDSAEFEALLHRPNGIVLVTGPTGSGKTTTLYAALHYLNRPDNKIITVEDPVEYQIRGINQAQVNARINYTFSRALRSILRQSPNIIMIGEIRDVETAGITAQASLTGHLVFSTLHTKDAAGAIVRLIDMGLPPYMIAASLQAVLAQRLVRRICEHCKTNYHPSEMELAAIGCASSETIMVYRGEGCQVCSGTGYQGRIGIFELLRVHESIRALIFKRALSQEIRDVAKISGTRLLFEDGLRKIFSGLTTIREVLRVVQAE